MAVSDGRIPSPGLSPTRPVAPISPTLSINGLPPTAAGASTTANDLKVTSPHELINWVEHVLGDLEANFDAMSNDVLDRLSTLSTRIDSLEASIFELTQGPATALANETESPRPTD